MDDDFDDVSAMWGVPLHESPGASPPPAAPPPAATPEPLEPFLLRGDEPPSDGVYRPRLRGFGDAA